MPTRKATGMTRARTMANRNVTRPMARLAAVLTTGGRITTPIASRMIQVNGWA